MNKVLIVNATAVGENNGTGVTLRNIWKGYSREHVLQLIVGWEDIEKDKDIPTIQTPAGFCRIPYTIHRKLSSKRKGNAGVASAGIRQQGFKACLHDFLRGTLDAFPVNFRCIMDRIREFAPDVIYTCGASIRVLKTANYISDKLGIPVILHLMDDWPETIYTTSPLSFPFHKVVEKLMRKIHKKSKLNLAISDALGDKYFSDYGVRYKALMNPAMKIEKEAHSVKENPRFLYAGSLNLNRWKSLLEIAKIIDSYRKEKNELKFTLYVPRGDIEVYKGKFLEYGAELKPYVPAEQLQEVYRESDVMVLAESFDIEVIVFAKYSLSTKIPEYMATGRLILAYLSNELHSSHYLKEGNLAIVASRIEELDSAIKRILFSPKECSALAENALKKAHKCHSIEACRETLLLAIETACNSLEV